MARLRPPDAGWTKTPNRLLDETARAGAALPARHRSLVDVLIRELFGWHHDAIAVSQRRLAARLRVSPRTVREALADLERWRVVRRRGAGRGRVALLELLDPAGWRISRTAGAIRTAERRRRARAADQPLLPFPDVAGVLDLPTHVGDRTRDRRGDVPRRLVAALLVKRKKSKRAATAAGGGTVRMALSRPGDRMPDDEPQRASAEEREAIRRQRAARLRVRRLRLGRPFDGELVGRVAAALSSEEIDEEIRLRELQLTVDADTRRLQLEAEAQRHEGRR